MAVLGIVAGGVVPMAAADTPPPAPGVPAGSGSVAGTELVDDGTFGGGGAICFVVTKTVYGVRGAGSYKGRTASGQEVVYEAVVDESQGQTLYADGPLRIEVENTETYYQDPFGTHGTTPGCAAATTGDPVPAEFRIFAPDHVYRLDGSGAQVPCVGHGTFWRGDKTDPTNKMANAKASWSLDADCTVVGNEAGTPGTGIAPAGSPHTYDGEHDPCFNAPCADNLRLDYQQFFPFEGLHVSMGGPSSAAVGDAVEVTAVVTDDGVALGNAPIVFSVAGPAPAPPGGAAVTGSDGTASFTFAPGAAGSYTVTATVTDPATTSTASGTFTVQVDPLPAAAMSLDGPTSGHTDAPVTLTATLTEAGRPLPGSPVAFSVAGPPEWQGYAEGQPSPASGQATTDENGQATFTFSAARAGDHTVTASSEVPGRPASATHAVHLDINSFYPAGSIPSSIEFSNPSDPALMDPVGRYAYLAGNRGMQKVDLRTFEAVDSNTISVHAGVIALDGRHAYVGTASTGSGAVTKVDLETMEAVDVLTLAPDESRLDAAVIDPAGRYAYFGADGGGGGGRVVKVDLTTFQRVGAITFPAEETEINVAVIDPAGRYAYFGLWASDDLGRVVKVDLDTFERVGSITLDGNFESYLGSAIIEPAGRFAYFGTATGANTPGRIIKVNLDTFQRAGALILDINTRSLTAAAIDSVGRFGYFGAGHWVPTAAGTEAGPGAVLKVDLAALQLAQTVYLPDGDLGKLNGAVIDPTGTFAYFAKDKTPPSYVPGEQLPARIERIAISRPPSPDLVARDDAYSTGYLTTLHVPATGGVLVNDSDEDADPLTAGQASTPAHGQVTLNRDGSFTYTPAVGFSGVDSFTYTASDAMDYSAPATVRVTVGAPPDGVSSVKGRAFGYLSDVSLFGGPTSRRGFGQVTTCTAPNTPAGCVPETSETASVEVPPSGGSVADTDPDGSTAKYGPATIFSSGRQHVTSQGTTGPGGSVTSSAEVADVNTSGQEVLTAAGLVSTCTASESGRSGSTTITGGTLVTSEGDPDIEGDETVVTLPVDPLPNTVYDGQLESVGDSFQYIFNEQVLNPDGSITVYAAHQKLLGPTAIGDLYIGKSECGVTGDGPPPAEAAAVADFDGDGATDVSVFRPSTGVWYLRQSTGGDRGVEFGAEGDVPVPGDYDGDGTTDLGVYRPSNGVWYLRQSTDGDTASPFGADGDVPVPGDYDGDGATDLGVYRPSTGVWYLRQSNDGDRATQFGAEGDVATPGDYDGDGTTDLGVFRPSTGVWYARQSLAGDRSSEFGVDGDVPVPGDYDGDGATDLGVYRPSTGTWYLRQSTDGDAASSFGVTGDLPVPGDYDGDGATDLGVHRPETNVWYLRRSTTGDTATQFGAPGDIPLPVPAAIRQSAFP